MEEAYDRLPNLILKYLNDDLTEEEKNEIDQLITLSGQNQQLFNQLTDKPWMAEKMERLDAIDTTAAWKKIEHRVPAPETPVVPMKVKMPMKIEMPKKIKRYLIAVSVIVMASAALYFIFSKKPDHTTRLAVTVNKTRDTVPSGYHKATLTLADGSTVVLRDAPNDTVALQGNVQVIRQNGTLIYQQTGTKSPGAAGLYNTLTTPRGERYQLLLEDGSKVWLNAASSLHFPVSFTGAARNVKLQGEAYFEVATRPVPFHVSVNQMDIEVLGTHFNVTAYDNEPVIKTTLFQGAVKVTHGRETCTLEPGKQAQLHRNGRLNKVDVDDPGIILAWMKGILIFRQASLEDVIPQIERAYNTALTYDGTSTHKLDATFYSTEPLKEVLRTLQEQLKVTIRETKR
jgi:transmembrane sensor